MKYLLSIILGCSILCFNAFAGEACCGSKGAKGQDEHKHKKENMCEMKCSGTVMKVNKEAKCAIIKTEDGKEVQVCCPTENCPLTDKEGKKVTIIGKGVEEKDDSGKTKQIIKEVEKVELEKTEQATTE